ncbi:unnamed protein product [Darwinula stevensoni]|uniref:VLIG-type G domain-containing protein n=1 Tax=Darwinula stevensoni TaxID=69355 RepID=A0A7R9A4W2_9CRUS|nr:unnamed protein product [Darwinula stevensoni]CAG0884212.1 unnamed protein product [Darwinula stevensoni]
MRFIFRFAAMELELQTCLGLRNYRKVKLLEALSLSWTDELAEKGETEKERTRASQEHPTPIIEFMQEIIATTGAYRDMDLPLPEKLRTECEETDDEKGEDDDKHNQEKLNDNMKIHPYDILTIAIQNSEPSLRQLLLGRLFLMGHGIPVVLPVSLHAATSELKEKRLELLVWALENIDVKYCGLYHPLVEFQAPFIGFIRVGKLHNNISKSKVINEALFEKHDTFFHSKLPLGEAKRLISNGVIEMTWAKVSLSPGRETSDSDENGSVKPAFILNLRGDAVSYPERVHLLGKLCSLVILFLGNESTQSLEGGDQALSDVVSRLTCTRGTMGARCTLLKGRRCALPNIDRIKGNNPNVKIVDLQFKTNCPIKAVRDEVNEELTRTSNSKSPTDTTNTEAFFSRKDVGEILNPADSVGDVFPGVAIDMNSRAILKSKALAEELAGEFMIGKTRSRKGECLPLSTEVLPNYAKNEHKKRHNKFFDSHEWKDMQQSLRSKQVLYISENRGISQNLLEFMKTLDRMPAEPIRNSLFYLGIKLDILSTEALNPLRVEWEKIWELLNISAKDFDTEGRNEKKLQLAEVERKMRESSLSLDNIFRELAQIYECLIDTDNRNIVSSLPGTMASLILDGMSMELLDGDNDYIPLKWLKDIFKCMESRARKIWVVSVIGIQSSGKSTMLNTIFGSDFLSRTGRCTKGVCMQFFPFDNSYQESESPRDYLVLLDTEGLRPHEFSDDYSGRRDNNLATFAIGLSDLTLLNVMGETPTDAKELLPTVIQGFIRMREVKIEPQVAIIHQSVREDADRSHQLGLKVLQEALEMKVAAKEEVLHTKITKFLDIIKLSLTEDVHYFPSLFQSGKLSIHSKEYGIKGKEIKKFILRKLLSRGGRDLNVFRRNLEQLWGAIMKENFAFNFRNVMEMAAYNVMESIVQSLVHETDVQLIKRWDEWKGEIMRANNECKVQEVCRKRKDELDSLAEEIFKEKAETLNEKINSSEGRTFYAMWRERITSQLRGLVCAKRDQICDCFAAKEIKQSAKFHVQYAVAEVIKKMELEIEQQGKGEDGSFEKVWNRWEGELTKAIGLNSTGLGIEDTLLEKMKLELLNLIPGKYLKEIQEDWDVKAEDKAKTIIRRGFESLFRKSPIMKRVHELSELCLRILDIQSITEAYARDGCMKRVITEIYACARRVTREDRKGQNKKTFTGYCFFTLIKDDDFETTMEFVKSPDQWKRKYMEKVALESQEKNQREFFDSTKKMKEFCNGTIGNFFEFLEDSDRIPLDFDYFIEMVNERLKLAYPIKHSSIVRDSCSDIAVKEVVPHLRDLVIKEREKIFEFSQVDLLGGDDEDSPISRLLKNLLGCLERCPFCRAECEHSFENHIQGEQNDSVTLHTTEIHNPQWDKTEEMVLETCPESIGSEARFKPSDEEEWTPYKEYKTKYPDWDIPPMEQETSPLFWKRFIARHAEALAETYGMKVSRELPQEWNQYTEEEGLSTIQLANVWNAFCGRHSINTPYDSLHFLISPSTEYEMTKKPPQTFPKNHVLVSAPVTAFCWP